MHPITSGMTVWAPVRRYDETEIRVRVALVENGYAWVKLPGGDAGTESIATGRCYPSTQAPMSIEEAQAAQFARRKA